MAVPTAYSDPAPRVGTSIARPRSAQLFPAQGRGDALQLRQELFSEGPDLPAPGVAQIAEAEILVQEEIIVPVGVIEGKGCPVLPIFILQADGLLLLPSRGKEDTLHRRHKQSECGENSLTQSRPGHQWLDDTAKVPPAVGEDGHPHRLRD